MKKINEILQRKLKERVSKDRIMIKEKYTWEKRGRYKDQGMMMG